MTYKPTTYRLAGDYDGVYFTEDEEDDIVFWSDIEEYIRALETIVKGGLEYDYGDANLMKAFDIYHKGQFK